MDYMKITISIILMVVFYILFGQESIAKLKKGGISISRNEEEPSVIKEPGKVDSKNAITTNSGCAGILLSVLSGDNYLDYRYNCVGKNKSLKAFQTCVMESKTPLIKNVGMNSYKQHLHLNSYSVSYIILPDNESIGVKRDFSKNPTFELNPAYSFVLALFDQDYLLFVSNPLVVHRSVIKVHSNSSNLMVGIKVS